MGRTRPSGIGSRLSFASWCATPLGLTTPAAVILHNRLHVGLRQHIRLRKIRQHIKSYRRLSKALRTACCRVPGCHMPGCHVAAMICQTVRLHQCPCKGTADSWLSWARLSCGGCDVPGCQIAPVSLQRRCRQLAVASSHVPGCHMPGCHVATMMCQAVMGQLWCARL